MAECFQHYDLVLTPSCGAVAWALGTVLTYDVDPVDGEYPLYYKASSLLFQLGCGSFIVRHGALRMSQISLALLAGGVALAAVGLYASLAFAVRRQSNHSRFRDQHAK